MYIVTIDIEKCEACGECIDICGDELLSMIEEDGQEYAEYTGDIDDCLGCYSCEEVCEYDAVSIQEM